jgi:hypothetical protein
LPGSIALSARYDAEKEISALAAGEETEVAGHRNTLTPMDPGNKSRDDMGICSGARIRADEIWESSRDKPRDDSLFVAKSW